MRIQLAARGKVFATRDRAAALRDEIVRDLRPGEPVEVDMSGVRALSYSFADELIGTLTASIVAIRSSAPTSLVMKAAAPARTASNSRSSSMCIERKINFEF